MSKIYRSYLSLRFVAIISLLVFCLNVNAFDIRKVRFNDEESDTSKITSILSSVEINDVRSPGEKVVEIGMKFLGTPYVASTLEGEPEMLTVNVSQFDCTTFVETVIAMVKTLEEGRNSWRDYLFNLQNIRYRSGEIDGYPSRLHYITDWGMDNVYRGNFSDATTSITRHQFIVRSLDFMSRNASSYSALADSMNLIRIKEVENGYRNVRFPYIKTINLSKKDVIDQLKNGDILAFVTNISNLDVSHMGILVFKDGIPHVLHASSSVGEVVLTDDSLYDFMKKNRNLIGIKVFRL